MTVDARLAAESQRRCLTKYDGLYDCGGLAVGDDLYFVSSPDGFCKIGRTSCLPSRLSTLQNGSPWVLRIELRLRGMGWQERVWHRAFNHLRARGEWFYKSADLGAAINAAEAGEEWIATLCDPHSPAGDREAHCLWRERIADMEERASEAIIIG